MNRAVALFFILILLLSATGSTKNRRRLEERRSAGTAALDTLTYVFVRDKTVTTGYDDSEYDDDVAEAIASGGGVYELGDDLDFAYNYVSSADEDGNYSNTGIRAGMHNGAENWNMGATATIVYAVLVRPDFADIPELMGTTVLDARMKFIINNSLYNSATDTLSTTLLEGADKWYDPTNLLVNNAEGWSMYAATSWNYQKVRRVDAEIDSRFPLGVSSDPWPWATANFTGWIWNMGSVHDMTNEPPDVDGCANATKRWNGCGGNESWLATEVFRYPMTRCVQAVLDGAQNDGFLLSGQAWVTGSQRAYSFAHFEDAPSALKAPWFVVKVATKKYESKFGPGVNGVIVLSTDDGRQDFNEAITDVIEALPNGGKMTIYIRGDAIGGDYLSYAEMKTLADAGHEIGVHSRDHDDSDAPWGGLNKWRPVGPLTATDWFPGAEHPADIDTATVSDWDGLLWDTDPDWLYDGLEAAGMDRATIEASRYIGNTFSLPRHQFNGRALEALSFHKYSGTRAGQVGNIAIDPLGDRDPAVWLRNERIHRAQRGNEFPFTSVENIAKVDTALVGHNEADPNRPVNAFMVPLTVSSNQIFGGNLDNPTDNYIRTQTRLLLTRIESVGNGVFSMYAHDFKTPNLNDYANGFSVAEFTVFADVADSMGFKFISLSDYTAMSQQREVDTPVLWENDPKWLASDRMFFEPWRTHYKPKSTAISAVVLPSPAYYTIWYEDPPASAPSEAQYDSLAAFDVVVTGPFSHQPSAQEPFYDNMLDSLRVRNSDIAMLSYSIPLTPADYWDTSTLPSAEKRSYNFLSAIPADAGWGRAITTGAIVESDVYPTRFVNVMFPDYADTMARYFADSFENSGLNGPNAGYFIDLCNSQLKDWICNTNDCTSLMDYDQDGTAYKNDPEEHVAFKAWMSRYVWALRKEFISRGMDDRLIVGNGALIRENQLVADLTDGYMYEGWNKDHPGIVSSSADWDTLLSQPSTLKFARTSPPIVMFHPSVDSSHVYMTEPLAFAGGVLIPVQNDGETTANDGISDMVRRLPDPGALISFDTSGDQITAVMENYTAYLATGSASTTAETWPYAVVSGEDIISIGGGWGDPLPPTGLSTIPAGGFITVLWSASATTAPLHPTRPYALWGSDTPGGPYEFVTYTAGLAAQEFGLGDTQTRYYVVLSIDPFDNVSDDSEEISGTTTTP